MVKSYTICIYTSICMVLHVFTTSICLSIELQTDSIKHNPITKKSNTVSLPRKNSVLRDPNLHQKSVFLRVYVELGDGNPKKYLLHLESARKRDPHEQSMVQPISVGVRVT